LDHAEIHLAVTSITDIHFTCVVIVHLITSGNIAPSLSVLSNDITTTCRRHNNDDVTLLTDQSELLDLDHPALWAWQVEVCLYVCMSCCAGL